MPENDKQYYCTAVVLIGEERQHALVKLVWNRQHETVIGELKSRRDIAGLPVKVVRLINADEDTSGPAADAMNKFGVLARKCEMTFDGHRSLTDLEMALTAIYRIGRTDGLREAYEQSKVKSSKLRTRRTSAKRK